MPGATAVYARISDDRQDGAGVARQLADCHTLCHTRPDWGQPRDYIDNDISAYSAAKRRPAYRELLAAVEAGEVGRIVVYHVDRLYRRPLELEALIQLADQGRVEVVSVVSGELDLSNSDGRFVARLLVSVAAKESEDKSRRVRRQKQQAREQGRPHGGRRAFGWLNGLEPHPVEAALVRWAVETLLAGASLGEVARIWNRDGVGRTQTGRVNWQADAVRHVVSNPRHAGLVGHRPPKTNFQGRQVRGAPVAVGTASWPAIVSRDAWERLQALLGRRALSVVPKRRSLLTGLLTCGACGMGLVRQSSAGRPILRCRGCNLSIDAARTEQLITATVLHVGDSADLAALIQQQEHGGEMSDLLIRLGPLDGRLDDLAATYARGALPARAFEHAAALVERERKDIQQRLGRISRNGAVLPYRNSPGLLRAAWPELTQDQRRGIVSALTERITVAPAARGLRFDPNRISVRWRT